MHLAVVAGARPNFVKVAPFMRAAASLGVGTSLIHTGQHYDEAMSESFFTDLEIRRPDANLEVGSGSHALQTALVMQRFERWLSDTSTVDAVVVFGDVNSTVACALVASKLGIPIAHVEAGLRSFDRSMPEEVNRLVVDALATWLLTPSADADANLLHEGVHPARITRVGNIMIDSLYFATERAARSDILDRLQVVADQFVLVTLHRPSLVDDRAVLRPILEMLATLSAMLSVVFPVHPRTKKTIDELSLSLPPSLIVIEPLAYLEFVKLESSARLVLTDSGGVQEETTALGISCLTLRTSTERPVTVTHGTNQVVGTDPARVLAAARAVLLERPPVRRPELWDGHTAERAIAALLQSVSSDAWKPYDLGQQR